MSDLVSGVRLRAALFMEIWYCDDNLARREHVRQAVTKYSIRTMNVAEAEALFEKERPTLVLTHSAAKELLKKVNAAGIPAMIVSDGGVRELKSVEVTTGNVVYISNLEEGIERFLPMGREYDITKPEVLMFRRDVGYRQCSNGHAVPGCAEGALVSPVAGARPLLKGEIIVVASGKGGVGKTTISLCLGLLLQKWGAKVFVIDFDFRCPCMENMLRLMRSGPLSIPPGVPAGAGLALLEACVYEHSSGMKVFLPNKGLVFSRRDTEELIRLVSGNWDVVIIDCGIETDERVKVCVEWATKVLLVTTLTAPSVKTCKAWFSAVAPRDMTKVYLLVNKLDKTAPFSVTAASRVMGIGFAGALPSDVRVVKGESDGEPLPLGGKFVKELSAVAEFVWPWGRGASKPRTGSPGLLSGIKGLIKR